MVASGTQGQRTSCVDFSEERSDIGVTRLDLKRIGKCYVTHVSNAAELVWVDPRDMMNRPHKT